MSQDLDGFAHDVHDGRALEGAFSRENGSRQDEYGRHRDTSSGIFISVDEVRDPKARFQWRMKRLLKLTAMVSARMRKLHAILGADVNNKEFACPGDLEITVQMLNSKGGKQQSLLHILRSHSFDQFESAAAWKEGHFPEPLKRNAILLQFPENQRKELLRQKIFHEIREQSKYFHELKEEIIDSANIKMLLDAIEELEKNPTTSYERQWREEYPQAHALDLPTSSSPEYTQLHRALMALKHEYEISMQKRDDVKNIATQTRNFVLAILNPETNVAFSNITDVYGSEPNVPGSETDVTRLRIHEHRKEIEEDYGVTLEVFDQGTTIKCPEQCGFFALVGLNQARRKNPGKRIASRFFALNNAARTEDSDHLKTADASASTGLMYFTFDLGDGVLHSGTAYGHQTLTYLKPYIKDLYEIEGTHAGTQFRSLEFQQHITTLVAMTGGAFPSCYKGKKLDKEMIIPSLRLASNECQYMGMDKYGNGITSKIANEVFAQFLPPDQKTTKVRVTLLDRKQQPIPETMPTEYTLAQSLGLVRDGSPALWQSSTPSTDNPKEGYLSIGEFMQKAGDTNSQVVNLTPGSIIRIEKIDSSPAQ